jgi:hypothetical protein
MKEVLLKEKINFEPYAEETNSVHPIHELIEELDNVSEALQKVSYHLMDLHQEFPGYIDFHYKLMQHWVGRGGLHSDWYNLYGVLKDETDK